MVGVAQHVDECLECVCVCVCVCVCMSNKSNTVEVVFSSELPVKELLMEFKFKYFTSQ